MSFWRQLWEKFAPRSDQEEIDWEALLWEADLGEDLVRSLCRGLERRGLQRKREEARRWIEAELKRILCDPPSSVKEGVGAKPKVVLLVGVNGSGKTTTAAKLAFRAIQENQRPWLIAADTFRAGAQEQLSQWARRLGVGLTEGTYGADPASVAYRGVGEARVAQADLAIVDTAGRLVKKRHLMEELAKVKRVLGKTVPGAPHEIWLVCDATSGLDVLLQAKEFHQALGLTGLIMTKLDTSGKGGMIAAVRHSLGISPVFLGTGEKPQDLQPWDPERYVREFFGE